MMIHLWHNYQTERSWKGVNEKEQIQECSLISCSGCPKKWVRNGNSMWRVDNDAYLMDVIRTIDG